MKERTVDSERAVIAHDQAAEVSQPTDGALHDPAPLVASQRPTVLRGGPNAILFVRTDQFDPAPTQALPQRITVVSLVGDHAHRFLSRSARAMAPAYPDRREQFLGKRFDIASDEVTGKQAAETISRVSGRKIEYVEIPITQVRATNEDFAKTFEWFDRVGYNVDTAVLRRDYPEAGWHTFEQWAKAQSWAVLKLAAAR